MRLSTLFTALRTQAIVVGATMVVGAAGVGLAMTGSANPAVWGSRLMSDFTSAGSGGGHNSQNGIVVASPSSSESPSPEPTPSESPSPEPTEKPESSPESSSTPSPKESDSEHSSLPAPMPTQTPEPSPTAPTEDGGGHGE